MWKAKNSLKLATIIYLLSACIAANATANQQKGVFYKNRSVSALITVTRSGTLGGPAELVGFALGNVAHSVSTLNLARLTKSLQGTPTAAALTNPAGLASPSAAKTAAGNSVFGSVAIPFKRLAALKKLEPTFAEIDAGTAIACTTACPESTTAIEASFTATAQSSLRDKLNAVNVAVNHTIRYARDIDVYQVEDHWATPSETLARREGDCEDFAILKMAALSRDGVDLNDMAIVVLFDQKRHFYHAVLSVAVGERYDILDNMRDDVLPDTMLADYLPLYSIRGNKGYLHGSRVQNAAVVANTVPLEAPPGEDTTF